MGYTYKEISFPSSDSVNTVAAYMFIPDGEVRAVVQISHGMIDHIGRYRELCEYFADRGIAVAGNDDLGHGRTAAIPEDLGYFAERDGYRYVIDDLYRMNALIREHIPGVPVVMLGHSMGSFMARLYAVKYHDTLDGIIIHGTGGANPLLAPGKIIAKLIRLLRGSRHRSKLITSLAFGSYNSHFPKEEGADAWLTRDVERVSDRQTDPYTSYKFTVSAYIDLFTVLGESNSKVWYINYPKELPTLIVSGDADPVGDYGRGVESVYNGLAAVGVKDVELKLYEGARHELFNETTRDEVFADLIAWLGERVIK